MSGIPGPSSDAAAAERNGSGSGSGNANSNDSGRGEGSSGTARTLHDVMREPSTSVPDVVVLDSLPEPEATKRKDVLDPKEDLWLSTVDGRYSSPIIPVTVGELPKQDTFYVHKHILLKSEYFKKALCGEFRESSTQSIQLPEEDPAIFHFLVAYLYEGRYEPIKPAASVLVPDKDKGKGVAGAETNADSDSDSDSSAASDVSARSRRRREQRRRREEHSRERSRRKHPNTHRPNCNCPQCAASIGPPCWSCRAPRFPPHPNAPITYVPDPLERQPRRPTRRDRRYGIPVPPPPPPPLTPPLDQRAPPPASITDPNGGRLASSEDLRTWLLAYELNIDVYILANRFLLDDFKASVARSTVDMLESAGSDAAVVDVLLLCRKLYDGLPESDPLLKMVFARVGFLQPFFVRRAERETSEFLMGNPEVAAGLLREMAARREEDVNGRVLPSMERAWYAGGYQNGGSGGPGGGGGVVGGGVARYMDRWRGVEPVFEALAAPLQGHRRRVY